jgi:hypothetical protein
VLALASGLFLNPLGLVVFGRSFWSPAEVRRPAPSIVAVPAAVS